MSDQSKKAPELVTIKIDDRELRVPKGQNIVDAAREAGVDIPHYCYHPHLSIAGNCRMCQVEIAGAPKLGIACNTTAAEGLAIRTHHSSPAVAEAQRATLEFLLINHPLDCTVCDQSGHCKLQDYYYDYNSTPSRFIEEKVHKVKAETLGPEVVYDGERCIMCTRCVRFCDEVTETSELGAFNRGDRGIIGIYPDRPLANELSGSVVDLCPVGALTHSRWRFNSRIWYTGQTDTICAGCSTGCNSKVAVRDEQFVQVKARLNSDVNQEWMCDEGRYGFDRFQPTVRCVEPLQRAANGGFASLPSHTSFKEAGSLLKGSGDDGAVLLSPLLTLEEMWVAVRFAETVMGVAANSGRIAVSLRTRALNTVQQRLVSPDYAANARAAELVGLSGGAVGAAEWRTALEQRYSELLGKIRSGAIKRLLLVGDLAVQPGDVDDALRGAVAAVPASVALGASGPGGVLGGALATPGQGIHESCRVLLPGRTVNEKSGILVNRDLRLQRLKSLLTAPNGTLPEWFMLNKIASHAGNALLASEIVEERALFREMVKAVPLLQGVSLMMIGESGIPLADIGKSGAGSAAVAVGSTSAGV